MKKRKLTIRVSYEPNRLAKNYLSDAYEKLIGHSIITNKINFCEEENFNIRKKILNI